MDSTTSCDQDQLEEMDVLSLYRVLEQVSDHRQKRGVRYPLALVSPPGDPGQAGWNDQPGRHCRVGPLAGRPVQTAAALPTSELALCLDLWQGLAPGRSRGGHAPDGPVAHSSVSHPALWLRTEPLTVPAGGTRAAYTCGLGRENPPGHAGPY